MGKVRDEMPREVLESLDKLADEEHKQYVSRGGKPSSPVQEADDSLTVYSVRLSNREKIQLRQLATKTGRPATEIAREFIRRGLEETLSPKGRIRPDSELGIRYLASISDSVSTIVDAFDLSGLKEPSRGQSKKGKAKPRRKKGD